MAYTRRVKETAIRMMLPPEIRRSKSTERESFITNRRVVACHAASLFYYLLLNKVCALELTLTNK
jgi:hypothetical protein